MEADRAAPSLLVGVTRITDFSDRGKDRDRLRGTLMSIIGGPGDLGRPSAQRSWDLDLAPLNNDLNDLRNEQDLLTGESSLSWARSLRRSRDLPLLPLGV